VSQNSRGLREASTLSRGRTSFTSTARSNGADRVGASVLITKCHLSCMYFCIFL
jgi:hypothetical protein